MTGAGAGTRRTGGGDVPWALDGPEVLQLLGTDPAVGLDDSEAAARLAADGPNEVQTRRPVSLARSVLGQLTDTLIRRARGRGAADRGDR